jgi:hypothetical protein
LYRVYFNGILLDVISISREQCHQYFGNKDKDTKENIEKAATLDRDCWDSYDTPRNGPNRPSFDF